MTYHFLQNIIFISKVIDLVLIKQKFVIIITNSKIYYIFFKIYLYLYIKQNQIIKNTIIYKVFIKDINLVCNKINFIT